MQREKAFSDDILATVRACERVLISNKFIQSLCKMDYDVGYEFKMNNYKESKQKLAPKEESNNSESWHFCQLCILKASGYHSFKVIIPLRSHIYQQN